MCLILFAYQSHPVYRLILAANRDEFYDRPTAPMGFWDEAPQVVAGRDLKAGGVWFGITKDGRWTALTNFRDPARSRPDAVSRGMLASRFLLGEDSPRSYLESLRKEADRYNGFNILVGDPISLYYFSNRAETFRPLLPGIHGLSNCFLDTPWPKVSRGKEALAQVISRPTMVVEDLFDVLSDRVQPEDADLPNTGVGKHWERVLSPRFIASPVYGTRCSTVLLIDNDNRVVLRERTFHSHSNAPDERSFEFQIERK